MDSASPTPPTPSEDLRRVAALLRERNRLDAELASIVQRPMSAGHLGEWIAARVFDIELESSATAKAVDGRFLSGPLQGRTVNIKWYLKQEGLLDLSASERLDHYLVLAGPRAAAASSRGTHRPWRIDAVYLFDAPRLLDATRARGVRTGVASSVLAAAWSEAEVFPRANALLPLTEEQRHALQLFGTPGG